MAIQLRRGVYNNFDPSKLLPGEVAVVQSGDPNTRNGKAVYIATLSGEIKRFAFVEDVEEIVYNVSDDIVEEINEQVADELSALQTGLNDLNNNLSDSDAINAYDLVGNYNLYPNKKTRITYGNSLVVKRTKNYIYLNGSHGSNLLRFAIFNDSVSYISSTAPSYSNRPAWYSPITKFVIGHTYKFSVKLVSGTYTWTGTSALDNFFDVRIQGNSNEILYQSKNTEWTCNKIPEMVCFAVGKGEYNNAVFELEILDIIEVDAIKHAGQDSTAPKLSILFHTDIHANAGAIDAINAYVTAHEDVIDDVICGGDMAQYEYSSSKNQYYFDSGLAAKSLCVIGNHDSAVYGSSTDWWGKTQKQVYDRYLAPYIASWNVVQPSDAATLGLNYYYKDYSLVRIIFLDAMFWDSAQREWLVSVLADAKTNAMSVLIVAHGTDGKFTGDLNCNWTWIEKPNETGFYSNLRFDGTAVAAVDDFITGGGEFIGWLTGHSHLDRIGYMTDYPTQLVFNMNDAGTKTANARAAIFSCTMVIIDRVNKLVKLVRAGCNYDAYLKPKHTLCYNYSTRTLISQT